MDTRKIAKEYRLAHWAQVMQERSTSGMSIRAYCESAGLCLNVYFYWQRKLRESACEGLAAVEAAAEQALVPSRLDHRVSPADSPVHPGWAVCKAAEAVPAKTLNIEINGVQVQVEPDTDPELLAKTCRMLKSLC